MRGPCFGPEVREVIGTARSDAVRLGATETGTEHLLLAVAASPTRAGAFLRERGVTPERVAQYADPLEVDAPLLAVLGIDAGAVQQHLDGNFGRDAWRRVFGSRQRRFSPEAARALREAVTHAKCTGQRTVDASTVLVGVLRAGHQAQVVLRRLGQDPVALQGQLFNAAA